MAVWPCLTRSPRLFRFWCPAPSKKSLCKSNATASVGQRQTSAASHLDLFVPRSFFFQVHRPTFGGTAHFQIELKGKCSTPEYTVKVSKLNKKAMYQEYLVCMFVCTYCLCNTVAELPCTHSGGLRQFGAVLGQYCLSEHQSQRIWYF